MLGDDAFKNAEKLVLLEQQAAKYQAQSAAYTAGLEKVLKNAGLTGKDVANIIAGDFSSLEGKKFTADDLDTITQYVEGLRDSNLQLVELNKQIQDMLPASFEAWNAKID